MNQLTQVFLLAAIAFLLFPMGLARGDVILTIGTNDSFDLDIDGSGSQTDGDLGITTHTFVLTGEDIPALAEFADITSITIELIGSGGNLSADDGTLFGGIGVASGGEGAGDSKLLSQGTSEVLTVNVSSTSTNPGQQVQISGMGFSSWRNQFPVSQVEFSGALVNGNNYHTGQSNTNQAIFDAPTYAVSVLAASDYAAGGGDPVRLKELHLSVNTVPEPACMIFCGIPIAAAFWRRRK